MPATTIDDFRPDRIQAVLKKDDWAIISAHVAPIPHAHPAIWAALMRDRTVTLSEKLRQAGYGVWHVTGRYEGQDEESLLVLGIGPRTAAAWGKEFGQQSVLVGRGILMCDEPRVLENDLAVAIEVLHTDKPTGDYTRIHATRTCFRVITATMQAEREAAKVAA